MNSYSFLSGRHRALVLLLGTVFITTSPRQAFALPHHSMMQKTQVVQQQKQLVTGVVTDATGEPIIGASVMVKGTSNGTVTDLNGRFRLSCSSDAVLVVSYIGYLSQEIPVVQIKNGKHEIAMREDTRALDEVVVIGYGTQRKGDVTSAIASVKSEDFTTGKVNDAAELIKGKVAGLTIAKGSGDPNQSSTIRLRGVISVNGSTTPLVLVDGVEGNLNTVAPEAIESIDVLKDASAAAIYGTRGANGVVLITTKNGKREERANVTYSGYLSASTYSNKLDFMNAQDVRDGKTDFADAGSDTDWLGLISRTGFTHNHNVNITGGGKQTAYSADFTYRRENGIIKKTYGDDTRMRFDVSHYMLDDMLKLNFNLVQQWHKNSVNDASNTGFANVYRQAVLRNPTSPVYNEDGTYDENFGTNEYYNPVELINERIGEYTYSQTRATGNITFEPIKRWKTNLMLATNRFVSHDRTYYSSKYWECQLNGYNGAAYHTSNESRTDNLEVTTRYDLHVGKHRADALLGYSYQYYTWEKFAANNKNFPTDFFQWNNLAAGSFLKDGKAGMESNKSENTLIGFFGRISYAYDNRYNLLVSIRREGSSKFGNDNKWGTFPSVSAGWTLSNEKFLKNVTWMNLLKLRLGYGVTGVIPNDSYMSLTRYKYGSTYYMDGDTWKQGLEVASNPNPKLKWEKSTEYNVGLDFSFFDDRLGASVDIYRKKTTGLLFWYNVPTPPNLFSTTYANGGSVRNQGIEVALSGVPLRNKGFEWKTTVTIAHNANKLLSLSNDLYESGSYMDVNKIQAPVSAYTHRMEEGRPLGEFYGLKSVGVSENGLFLIEKPDGEIVEYNSTMQSNDEYRQYLGNGLPKVYLGWNNTLRYKNWNLSMQFTGQFGFKILNCSRMFYENNAIPYNKLKSVENAPYGSNYTLSSSQQAAFVSYYLENGDFLKLTNLTLGYNIPVKPNRYLKGARAYVSGDNLFCITGYSGLDPELSNASPTYAGMDSREQYPSIRSFTFGVNLIF